MTDTEDEQASIRILVVDDEPPIADLVRGYLAREGFEVVTAGDGPAACSRCSRSTRSDPARP